MKQTLKNSFYQLIGIYTLVILFISLGLFWKYSLQFHLIAIIISILGILIIPKTKLEENKIRYFNILTILALILTFVIRFLPYLKNNIPLGYDAGIYKYAVETSLNNIPEWMITQITMEPLFVFLANILKTFFSSQIILTYIFILFAVLLGFAILLVTKEYFGKKAAIISLFIYAFSIIQFKTFEFMYYRNIIGITLALFSIYFYKRNIYLFILFAALTGAMHRATFYLLGLSYLFYTFISPYNNKKYNLNKLKKNILIGISILIITLLFYLGDYFRAITSIFEPLFRGYIETGTAPGTFINFFTYQYSVLAYLPFALLGFFYLIRNKQYNMLFFWSIITFIIVYFQFFFFNRFIIMLDIALIILASLGFSILILKNKKLGYIVLTMMLFSLAFVTINESINVKPLISNEELDTIEYLQNTEENSFVMATSSTYSPYVLGYSYRKTIAPGLFEYNKHDEQEWQEFWTTEDPEKIKEFMNVYEKPLYIFIGQKQQDNLEQFKECFNIYNENKKNKIYKYVC